MNWFRTQIVGEVGPSGNVTDQVTLFTNRYDPFAPTYFDTLEPWTFTVDYWNNQPIGQALYQYDEPQPWALDVRFGPSLLYEQHWQGMDQDVPDKPEKVGSIHIPYVEFLEFPMEDGLELFGA